MTVGVGDESTVTWDKPGPGTWDLDASHVGPAPGPIIRRLFAETMPAGTAEGFREYGAPLACFDVGWVHGKYYLRIVPLVGAGPEEGRPPPAVVPRLFTRLHPTFRRRERRAAETFRTKRWRRDLDRWATEWKPALLSANTRLSEMRVAELSRHELAAHLRELDQHVIAGLTLHHRLGPPMAAPLGNLMVHLEDWGLDPLSAVRALAAASPATRAPVERQREIAAAIAADAADGLPATLDDIRAVSPTVAGLLDAYLRDHGWRLTTGYDLEDRCLIELPDAVVASVTAAGNRPVDLPDAGDGVRELAELRAEIPPQHHAAFDELVADAREAYGLRDENGPLTYEWPAGLLRRAVLECGRRLAADGRLLDPVDVFELDVPEIAALLTDAGGPDLEAIAARAAERRRWAELRAPRRLGLDPVEVPPSVLPPNLERVTRIVTLIMSHLQAAPAHDALQGTGIGTTTVTGRARVVRDAEQALACMEQGDVLVVRYTTPTYNAVLTMAGALVTAEGGSMSHAAVIARELGLPAVIGAAGAMDQINDGDMITVDPSRGTVSGS